MAQSSLQARIRQIARWQRFLLTMEIAGFVLGLFLCMTSATQLSGRWRAVSLVCAAAAFGGAFLASRRTLAASPAHIARQLDALLGSGSQIQCGVELAFSVDRPSYDPISIVLTRLTIDRAARLTSQVSPRRLASPRPLAVPAAVIASGIALMLFHQPVPRHTPPARVLSSNTMPPQHPRANLSPRVTTFAPVETSADSVIPHVSDIRCKVTAPPDSARPPYEGVIPPGGIVALPGTTIAISAKCAAPVAGGNIEFTPDNTFDSSTGMVYAPISQPMTADAAAPDQVTGSIVVSTTGHFAVRIDDGTGVTLPDVVDSPVVVTEDLPPLVQIVQPTSTVFAAPDGTVTLDVVALDDFGISRLLLCRSLNGVVAPPLDIPVQPADAIRCPMRITVKLSDWKLNDGDVVKLFIRAENENPHGAMRADSVDVTVNIVSQKTHTPAPSAALLDWLPLCSARN